MPFGNVAGQATMLVRELQRVAPETSTSPPLMFPYQLIYTTQATELYLVEQGARDCSSILHRATDRLMLPSRRRHPPGRAELHLAPRPRCRHTLFGHQARFNIFSAVDAALNSLLDR